jgi:flagellar hook-associated protein 2
MSSTSSTSSSYYSVYAADPASTAKTFADQYTAGATALLKTQTDAATATASALTQLETALTTFQGSLAALTTGNTSVLAQTATFTGGVAGTVYGTATAKAGAVPSSYSFFVQQIATAGQVSYGGLTPSTAANSGTLVVNQTGLGNTFSVDLSAADTDKDGSLTPIEIAAAINSASGNDGTVTASVVTVNGTSQLSLLSTATGSKTAISIDASGVTNTALSAALTNSGNVTQGPAPLDATIWLGDQNNGTEITQASNTFTNINGVSMTFTKAMTTGTAPITLTVATDPSGTATNLQNFVAAYNALKKVLTPLLDLGDPSSSSNSPGAFSSDAGVRSLSNKLVSLVTQTVGGISLANYGITNQLDGTLALNTTQLNKTLAANPSGLSTLMGGSTGVGGGTGMLGSVDQFVETWSDAGTGFITKRQSDITSTQTKLAQQQTDLDNNYNDAYARYLAQFTQLQTTETAMHTNTDLFDALFGSGSSN